MFGHLSLAFIEPVARILRYHDISSHLFVVFLSFLMQVTLFRVEIPPIILMFGTRLQRTMRVELKQINLNGYQKSKLTVSIN